MHTYIKPLTSLRGMAALIVVIHHFSYYGLPEIGEFFSTYSDFFKNGYLCVDFFFILSGFIMTHVYVNNFNSGVILPQYYSYMLARFARIYPLHLFMILLFLGLEIIKLFFPNTQHFTGKFNLTALFANIFMLQAFDLSCPPLFNCDTYWNEPAWSISVEFTIYCIFPFLLFFIFRNQIFSELMIYLITFVSILLLIILSAGNLDNIIGIPSIGRCGLECILGVLTCKIYLEEKYKKYLRLNLLGIISLIWIGLIMHYNFGDSRIIRSVHDWSILPAFSLIMLFVSINKNHVIIKALNSSLFLYLGKISYSIYMVHWFFQEIIKKIWLYKFHVNFGFDFNVYQVLACLGIFFIVILFAASMSYRFIEMPMRNYLKNRKILQKYT